MSYKRSYCSRTALWRNGSVPSFYLGGESSILSGATV